MEIKVETKECNTCKLTKDINCFRKSKSNYTSKYWYSNRCIVCQNKWVMNKRNNLPLKDKEKLQKSSRDWKSKNKEEVSFRTFLYRMKKKYGLTKEDYQNMLKDQNFRCKICTKTIFEFKSRFVVDHDHRTGKVRGLLCNKCNAGLGMFQDNIFILEYARQYLIKSNGDKLQETPVLFN